MTLSCDVHFHYNTLYSLYVTHNRFQQTHLVPTNSTDQLELLASKIQEWRDIVRSQVETAMVVTLTKIHEQILLFLPSFILYLQQKQKKHQAEVIEEVNEQLLMTYVELELYSNSYPSETEDGVYLKTYTTQILKSVVEKHLPAIKENEFPVDQFKSFVNYYLNEIISSSNLNFVYYYMNLVDEEATTALKNNHDIVTQFFSKLNVDESNKPMKEMQNNTDQLLSSIHNNSISDDDLITMIKDNHNEYTAFQQQIFDDTSLKDCMEDLKEIHSKLAESYKNFTLQTTRQGTIKLLKEQTHPDQARLTELNDMQIQFVVSEELRTKLKNIPKLMEEVLHNIVLVNKIATRHGLHLEAQKSLSEHQKTVINTLGS